jgi:hypothetical protein
MNHTSSEDILKIAREKRILNEFEVRTVNEYRMDQVIESKKGQRDASHSTMQFNCECDDATCLAVISLSTEEYQRVHRKPNYFIVIPSHVHRDLEKVISSFNNYVLVEKLLMQSG